VRGRYISAVACYGPKAGPVREFLTGVQAMIAAEIGSSFLPYSLEQIHATLIALDGTRDTETGAIVNTFYLMHAGRRVQMNLPQVMDTLLARFEHRMQVRLGGFAARQEIPFTSRGWQLYDRAFSVQGNAFVLVGWPVASLTGPARPLDDLRREMNAAGVLHRYHASDADVDNDLHLVVGHHADAPAGALARAQAAVRDQLAAYPFEFEIGLGDVKVVASDSRTLAPPLYVSDIPADSEALRALMSLPAGPAGQVPPGPDAGGRNARAGRTQPDRSEEGSWFFLRCTW